MGYTNYPSRPTDQVSFGGFTGDALYETANWRGATTTYWLYSNGSTQKNVFIRDAFNYSSTGPAATKVSRACIVNGKGF